MVERDSRLDRKVTEAADTNVNLTWNPTHGVCEHAFLLYIEQGSHLAHRSNQLPMAPLLCSWPCPLHPYSSLFTSFLLPQGKQLLLQPKVPSPEICRGMAPGCCRILRLNFPTLVSCPFVPFGKHVLSSSNNSWGHGLNVFVGHDNSPFHLEPFVSWTHCMS